MATTTPPKRELGVVSNQPPAPLGWASLGSSMVDESETSWKLRHPQSVIVYQEMLRDSQIAALRAAVFLALMRRNWQLDPNGSDPQVLAHVADDLGLPVAGEDAKPRVISAKRFGWKKHLEHVLRAPFFGHYFFTQFAPIENGQARLRKLLPLPPRTIQDIKVADDGGLQWVRQWTSRGATSFQLPDPIPVTALVAYVWEQEAGNWFGESMLRAVYRDWLAKDDLIRGNLTKMRRNGMGVPVAEATAPEGNQELTKAAAIARAWRAGEESSAGFPYGTRIVLKGVEGTIPDHVPSIRMHDEAMARRFLSMILQLGQTEHGSRALGEDFVGLLGMFQDHAAEWVCETATLHVIRDLVDWNYGEDAQCPILIAPRDEDPELSIEDMKALVDAGLLTVDADFEDYLRGRYRLPAKASAELRAAAMRRAAAPKLPDRPVRRKPNQAEIRAAVDFDALEMTFEDGIAGLVADWTGVRAAQLEQVADAIRQADGNAELLASITVEPAGADVLLTRMRAAAQDGIAGATAEAAQQGAALEAPVIDTLEASLTNRANAGARLLANALAEVTSRRAVALTGGTITPDEVADQVIAHVEGLSDKYLEDQFNGLLNEAVASGRGAVMDTAGDQITAIYASALLDRNACAPCVEWDGFQFDDLTAAEAQFPTGGNSACLGGPRCRCTLVAVYDETPASVA